MHNNDTTNHMGQHHTTGLGGRHTHVCIASNFVHKSILKVSGVHQPKVGTHTWLKSMQVTCYA